MSFRCENQSCQIVTERGQPINRIVTERRDKQYEKLFTKGKRKGQVDEIIYGWEIVKEIKVCPRCYRILTGMQPKTILNNNKKFKNAPQEKPKYKQRRFKDNKYKKNVSSKQNKPEQKVSRKKPVVEVINPLPIVKG